ncbi:MAG: hypothetical protein R3F59_12140 [Myxococcota bacterium]
MLSAKWGANVSGYLAHAGLYEGLGAHELATRFGLDYRNNPYLVWDGHGRGFHFVDEVGVLEMAATPELVEKSKVPVHPAIHAHVEALADAGEPWAVALMGRLHDPSTEQRLYHYANGAPKPRSMGNPHGGLGVGRAGRIALNTYEGTDPSALGAELKVDRSAGGAAALPEGSRATIVDADGRRRVVAELRGGRWELTADAHRELTPGQLAAFGDAIDQQKVPAAPKAGPPGPPSGPPSGPAPSGRERRRRCRRGRRRRRPCRRAPCPSPTTRPTASRPRATPIRGCATTCRSRRRPRRRTPTSTPTRSPRASPPGASSSSGPRTASPRRTSPTGCCARTAWPGPSPTRP